jgi:hypothetical protein
MKWVSLSFAKFTNFEEGEREMMVAINGKSHREK